jgi:hypothetical protein
VKDLAFRKRDDLERAVRAPKRDARLVGREVGGQDGVDFIAHRLIAGPGLGVEKNRLARFSPLSTGGE